MRQRQSGTPRLPAQSVEVERALAALFDRPADYTELVRGTAKLSGEIPGLVAAANPMLGALYLHFSTAGT